MRREFGRAQPPELGRVVGALSKYADAPVLVVDYRMMGATGRVYLSGEESSIRAAASAAEHALRARG